ncbi:MAG: carbohydrate ABC transporter permease [Chloroflexi bacterium]|nr:carbohydrate ABC transporter permease [Chloroflexota bacterium]
MFVNIGNKRANVNNIVSFVLLVGLSAAFILPLFWMITTSLKPIDQLLLDPPVWIPRPLEFDNYPKALEAQPFLQYLGNSLQIAVAAVIGAIVSNSLVAYGFSRVEWRGRDAVFVLVLSTLMLPYHVVMIPLFVSFSKIGWVNTWLPLIAPAWLGHPFFIFMLRQFMLGIPKELSEATRIDGGSEWILLTRVILPLCKPALATVALFQFIWSWNDFIGPLIYLNDRSLYPMSLGLALYHNSQGITDFSILMAASTMAVVPIIIIFFLMQRVFIQGISLTGLKG